jgi:hypothetical protein
MTTSVAKSVGSTEGSVSVVAGSRQSLEVQASRECLLHVHSFTSFKGAVHVEVLCARCPYGKMFRCGDNGKSQLQGLFSHPIDVTLSEGECLAKGACTCIRSDDRT